MPPTDPEVVIVEDHPVALEILADLVRAEGHEPRLFRDPRAAADHARAAEPAVWITDWMMPGLTGLEIVSAVRAAPDGDRASVIMQTARQSNDDLVRAFEAGVNDFIRKPIDPGELRARLRSALRQVRLLAALERQLREIDALNARLTTLARTDALTGLPNRRAAMEFFQEAHAVSSRKHRPISVGLIDLDRFKLVNDTHGHAAGDRVLQEAAARLATAVRAIDRLARFGGEEFVVILPETDEHEARAVLERCRATLASSPVRWEDADLAVTLSAGVACAHTGALSPDELLQRADEALYVAKEQGRDRVVTSSHHRGVRAAS